VLKTTFDRILHSPFRAGVIIFLVSLAIRVAFIWHTPLDLAIAEPKHVALALLQHNGFANPFKCPTGPTAHCNPFLPVLIAGLYFVFGAGNPGELARCLVCAAVLSFSYALLPWFARRLRLPASIGAIAGLACALFPFMRTSETVSFSDEPFVALALLALTAYCFSLLNKKSLSWTDGVCYGVAWGAAFYVSPSLLPVWIGTLLLLFLTSSSPARSRTAAILGLSLVAALLVVTPWTLRNYRVLHTVIFMRSNLGLELSLANSDGARPSLKQNLFLADHHVANHPLTSDVECLAVQQLGEGQYNRRKLRAAFHWIEEHRSTFVKLTATRIFYFWAGDPLDYTTAIPNTVLSLAGLIGCLLLVRQHPYAGLLIACALVFYPLIYYLTQSTPRYTLPIHPLVALCAAYALWPLLEPYFAPWGMATKGGRGG
jgi:4-amino-4-deoxy-L-arabinose transferase-like glycosyltransferase